MSSFLRVLRYIHQNPVKAGIITNVFAYKWSSIHAYIGYSTFIDCEPGLQLFSSSDLTQAYQNFSEYMQLKNDDVFVDDNITADKSDLEIRNHLNALGIPNASVLQQMNRNYRNAILSELKEWKGISLRQLARITGI